MECDAPVVQTLLSQRDRPESEASTLRTVLVNCARTEAQFVSRVQESSEKRVNEIEFRHRSGGSLPVPFGHRLLSMTRPSRDLKTGSTIAHRSFDKSRADFGSAEETAVIDNRSREGLIFAS